MMDVLEHINQLRCDCEILHSHLQTFADEHQSESWFSFEWANLLLAFNRDEQDIVLNNLYTQYKRLKFDAERRRNDSDIQDNSAARGPDSPRRGQEGDA